MSIIPTLMKKEDMSIEQLAGYARHVVIKLAKNCYKIMPEEALQHPNEEYFNQYCDKRELRGILEDLYDQEQNNKTAGE